MKDEGGNAALIPGSSAWGALKGGTSQKPLILSSDGSAVSNEKTSPKPSVDKSWPPSSSAMHINGLVTRWGGSSGSTNGMWSENKDIGSGWGSPDSSPIPNAGTEVWSAQKQSESASSRWGSNNATGSVWAGGDAKNSIDTESKSVWAQPASQPSVWGSTGDARPVSILSAASNHWAGHDQGSNWGSSSPQPTAIVTSAFSTWAQAAGRGLTVSAVSKPGGSSAPGSNMSREELIVRAINSQDGWGQTPIRQDTAWDVTAEPSVNNIAAKIPPPPPPPPELSIQHPSNTGTAIWETSKDSPQVLSSELSPHTLLASSGKESIVSKLPWVSSEVSLGAGWDIPLQVEGNALVSGNSGERSLPSAKPGTNSSGWCALLDSKDTAVVNPWSADTAQYGTGPQMADGAALTALLDKYERQAPSAVWDSSGLQPDGPTDAGTVNTSPTWDGQSGCALVSPDPRNDIWSQAGASKSAHWGSSKSSDSAIWNSTSLVSSLV